MDPVSAFGLGISLITLASALLKTAKILKRCARGMAHASGEVEDLAEETEDFTTLLEYLRTTIDGVPRDLLPSIQFCEIEKVLYKSAKKINGRFWQLLDDLGPLWYDTDPNAWQRLAAKYRWTKLSPKALHLHKKLNAIKSSLSLLIQTVTLKSVCHLLAEACSVQRSDSSKIEMLEIRVKLLRQHIRLEKKRAERAANECQQLQEQSESPMQDEETTDITNLTIHLAEKELKKGPAPGRSSAPTASSKSTYSSNTSSSSPRGAVSPDLRRDQVSMYRRDRPSPYSLENIARGPFHPTPPSTSPSMRSTSSGSYVVDPDIVEVIENPRQGPIAPGTIEEIDFPGQSPVRNIVVEQPDSSDQAITEVGPSDRRMVMRPVIDEGSGTRVKDENGNISFQWQDKNDK